jgi:serine/threonine protein kinase
LYYPTVDIWSVGCILYEIAHKKILFCGDSEIDQIFKIFQVMGTPSETLWKDVTKLKDFKPTFPKWRGGELDGMSNKLSKDGIDLVKKMLVYDPV